MNITTSLLVIFGLCLLLFGAAYIVRNFHEFIQDWTRVKRWRGLVTWLLALTAIILASESQAQVTPVSINVATNIPAFWLTAASTNITSYIPVRQGKSLNIQWQFSLSGSGVDNNQLYLRPRIDGTNVTTLMPTVINALGNGTTTVTAWTNLPAHTIWGIVDFAITLGTNGTARTLYESNIIYTYGN